MLIHTGRAIAGLPVHFDEAVPQRHGISVLNTLTLQTLPFLSDPDHDEYQGHFSHDGRWVAFNCIKGQHSRIYVAPFATHVVPITDWIPVSDGTTWDDKQRFSGDDKLIFFTSDRDGFWCIWAQRLKPDMHPEGDVFSVYHFHSVKRSLGNAATARLELAVGSDNIIFNQVEYNGNLWLLDRK